MEKANCIEQETGVGPQYRRTHKAICNALIELLKDKPFEKITVQDILDATPVTRTTFYKHFADKYQVAEELQAEYLTMVANVRATMKERDISEYSRIAQKTAVHYADLSKALIKIHTDTVDLSEMLKSSLRETYLQHSAPVLEQTGSVAALSAEIYAGAVVGFEIGSLPSLSPDTDSRVLYNEVMIGAFLASLELEGDTYLRSYLRKKVNHET